MKSWSAKCPRNIAAVNPVTQKCRGDYMQTRNRACNLIASYDILRKSENLNPDMHIAFLKIIFGAADFLSFYVSDTMDMMFPALLGAGIYFPEFIMSTNWINKGNANLIQNVPERMTPEGLAGSFSAAYNDVTINLALRILEIISANSLERTYSELFNIIRNQAQKTWQTMFLLTMPNEGFPGIGDCYGRQDWSNGFISIRSDKYIAALCSKPEKEEVQKMSTVYDKIKYLAELTSLKEVSLQRDVSCSFSGTGAYVMRNHWKNADSPYMYVDLTPQKMAHAHEDALHFEMYAYGKPLFADTGDYWLGWGYRTALHNTIEINGLSQSRGCEVHPGTWISSPHYIHFDGAHRGYAQFDVTHRRKIVYLKSSDPRYYDYWVLADIVTGGKAGEAHTVEQFFHFAGPSQLDGAKAEILKNKSVRSVHKNTANVIIVPADTGASVRLLQAEDTDMKPEDKQKRKAMLGWIVTQGTHKKEKSAVAVYSNTSSLPFSIYQTLFPFPAGIDGDIIAQALPASRDGKAVPGDIAGGMKITAKVPDRNNTSLVREWIYYILFSHTGIGEYTYAEFMCDGTTAVLRTSSKGTPQHAFLHNARTLRMNNKTLVIFSENVPYAEISWDEKKISVTLPLETGFSVNGLGAGTVYVNGMPVNTTERDDARVFVPSPVVKPNQITETSVSMDIPNPGILGGAQPRATLKWKTSLPSRGWVSYEEGGTYTRYTPFQSTAGTSHSAEAFFLRFSTAYRFTITMWDSNGRITRHMIDAVSPGAGE